MSSCRRALPADAEQVFTLAREFATSFQTEPDAFRVSFARLLAQDDALLLVAEESGEIIGYLLGFDHFTLFANGRVAWVEEVMVHAGRRRAGIGATLTLEFERWATARGNKLVALATRRAASFYLALGYEESAAYLRKVLSQEAAR